MSTNTAERARSVPPLDEIIENFEFLDDWEDRYRYLIELGRTLPPYPEEVRDEAHLVRGCASQVWLDARHGEGGAADDPVLALHADSDAHIVSGLVALALAAYDGRPASEVEAFEIGPVLKRIGLDEHLTPQRANGFASLIGRIKEEARLARG